MRPETKNKYADEGQQQFTGLNCELAVSVASQQGHGHSTRAISIVRSRYLAMPSEDMEDLIFAVLN
jgi:hypothetical protein